MFRMLLMIQYFNLMYLVVDAMIDRVLITYISGQITTGPKSKFISEAKLRNIRNASPGTKASNRLDVQEFRRYLEEDDNRKKCQERAGEEYSWLPRQDISSNEQYPGIHSHEC